MCKRFDVRRVPSRHCRHLQEHGVPGVTRHAGPTRRRPSPATGRRRITATPREGRQARSRARPRVGRGLPRDGVQQTSQTPVSDPSSRGRRACGTWSLSRIGRVSSSGCGSPTAAHALRARPPKVSSSRRSGRGRRHGHRRSGVLIAGNSPVSALRCRPGSTAIAARCRPAAAAADATASSSGSAGSPTSGARRRPPDRGAEGAAATTVSGPSGARRRPPERGDAAPSPSRVPRARGDGRRSGRRTGHGPRACSPSRRSWPGAGRSRRAADDARGSFWVDDASTGDGRLGRDRQVTLREAQTGEVHPRRLLDAAEVDPDPHLAGPVGLVPPAEQLTRPPRARLEDLDGLGLTGEHRCTTFHGA